MKQGSLMCENFAMKICTSKAWWAALGLQEEYNIDQDAFSCAAADTGNGSRNRKAVVSKVAFKGYAVSSCTQIS
jgi:hypothetical protein